MDGKKIKMYTEKANGVDKWKELIDKRRGKRVIRYCLVNSYIYTHKLSWKEKPDRWGVQNVKKVVPLFGLLQCLKKREDLLIYFTNINP